MAWPVSSCVPTFTLLHLAAPCMLLPPQSSRADGVCSHCPQKSSCRRYGRGVKDDGLWHSASKNVGGVAGFRAGWYCGIFLLPTIVLWYVAEVAEWTARRRQEVVGASMLGLRVCLYCRATMYVSLVSVSYWWRPSDCSFVGLEVSRTVQHAESLTHVGGGVGGGVLLVVACVSWEVCSVVVDETESASACLGGEVGVAR